eukprot:COSAG01_NODE_629_length_14689_cov_298.955517_5_plen_314_part_00
MATRTPVLSNSHGRLSPLSHNASKLGPAPVCRELDVLSAADGSQDDVIWKEADAHGRACQQVVRRRRWVRAQCKAVALADVALATAVSDTLRQALGADQVWLPGPFLGRFSPPPAAPPPDGQQAGPRRSQSHQRPGWVDAQDGPIALWLPSDDFWWLSDGGGGGAALCSQATLVRLNSRARVVTRARADHGRASSSSSSSSSSSDASSASGSQPKQASTQLQASVDQVSRVTQQHQHQGRVPPLILPTPPSPEGPGCWLALLERPGRLAYHPAGRLPLGASDERGGRAAAVPPPPRHEYPDRNPELTEIPLRF